MTSVKASSIVSSLTSFGNITFTNSPNLPTATSTDNSTKVATTNFVMSTVNLSANYAPFIIRIEPILLSTIKTFSGAFFTDSISNGTGILTLGDATTTSLSIGRSSATPTNISILGQLLALNSTWKYAVFGNSTHTQSAIKIQRGSMNWTNVAQTLLFPQAFSSTPSIILTGSSTTTANYSSQGLSTTGCNVRSTNTVSNVVYWVAVGN